MQGQFTTAARRLGALPALPWLPPNRTFGCFVAAALLMLSVATLFGGMPAEKFVGMVPHSRAGFVHETYLPVPASGRIPQDVLRDDPLPPRPNYLFRADRGTFHTPWSGYQPFAARGCARSSRTSRRAPRPTSSSRLAIEQRQILVPPKAVDICCPIS